jgi:hypothetical protein
LIQAANGENLLSLGLKFVALGLFFIYLNRIPVIV